ncbi:bifunctional adenosylcobinamide kinase/adenosylcobinamide-phosphate guanylyltransferase [Rhodocytophaga rosea]|uniref:Adenosylcobinamide kinase n=1 Tax=Rhodocytophaga rosea TaxID=2704465 RepID=A0A6C0GSH8_9BACT|nr:bifunctional adenosylcobinamide kinase/adenosylcobinamide-phosphate guanylyltransferase [Rhodocytophaga rosea]QHT71068.1 bifunctional adenosylcobinamide kinase/adenosylcobinamide-phosphate guanylyltransferase [Rhodocytophaga rosea]
MIIFITGGERSGKSRYAQNRALSLSANPVYVATARHWGGDFEDRIRRHQQERGSEWTNYEEEKLVSALPLQQKVVVVDCVTLWLTNFFSDYKSDVQESLTAFKREIDALQKIDATFLIVSNEIGMGLHATTEVGRKFVELQGWANQHVASLAEEVIFMVSGIPLHVKPSLEKS